MCDRFSHINKIKSRYIVHCRHFILNVICKLHVTLQDCCYWIVISQLHIYVVIYVQSEAGLKVGLRSEGHQIGMEIGNTLLQEVQESAAIEI